MWNTIGITITKTICDYHIPGLPEKLGASFTDMPPYRGEGAIVDE
jgi:hypothetical protein